MWTQRLVAQARLDMPLAGFVAHHIREITADALNAAARDLARLARVRRLPDRIWSATGGRYATRAVCIEARNRNAQIERFSHGGALAFDAYADILAYVDLTPCSRFFAPTKGAADMLRTRVGALPPGAHSNAEIVGGQGDPIFAVPLGRTSRPAGRPGIVYCPSLFVGSICHFPPLPADPVYLDWQVRVVEGLKKLPVSARLRPHPENLVLHGCQPLEGRLDAAGGTFRDVIDEADILLFDWPLSTSFWEALCSNRRVVLFDMSGAQFHPDALPVITRRCRIVPTTTDERNRPVFDPSLLESAIFDDRHDTDPAEIRALLAGDA